MRMVNNIGKQLHEAISKGNVEMVKQLLDENLVNVHTRCNTRTPLHTAVEHNQVEVVKALLKYNPDVNIRAFRVQEAPLHIACRHGYFDIAKLLLDSGAFVNLATWRLDTALHIAIRREQIDIVRLLLMYNSDINFENALGNTPVHLACSSGNEGVLKLLLQDKKGHVNAECLNRDGDSPLHVASRNLDIDICSLLLDYHVDVNITNFYGCTPLLEVAYANYKESVKCKRSKNSKKPLEFDESIYLKISELLLKNGANLNCANEDSDTALHIVCRGFGIELAKLLIKHKAPLNFQNLYGCTPMHLCQDENILKLLLLYGADPDLKDKNGQSALESLKKIFTDLHTTTIQYKNEINAIKNLKLTSYVSLYDFLFMSVRSAARYVENRNLKKVWNKETGFKKEFPLFGEVFDSKYDKALNKKKITNKAKSILQNLTGFIIPDLCCEELFNLLSDFHLTKLQEINLDSMKKPEETKISSKRSKIKKQK